MEEEAKYFLASLVQKDALFLLFLAFISIVLVAFNNATIGTVTISIPPSGLRFLYFLAFGFAGLGVWQLLRPSAKISPPRTEESQPLEYLLESQRELKSINQEYKSTIAILRQAIRDIQSVASQERTYASSQIIQIIEDLNLAVINYQDRIIDPHLVTQWMRARINDWLLSVQPMERLNIAKEDVEAFNSELRLYLNLLCENIINGSFVNPDLKGLETNKNNVFSYKEALKNIKKEIISEFDADEYHVFSDRQQQEVLDSISQLIDDIQ